MKMLSSIATHNEVFAKTNGYVFIKLATGWIKRKVTSKPFSNYSVDTVTINKEKYLIDSKMDVRSSASAMQAGVIFG